MNNAALHLRAAIGLFGAAVALTAGCGKGDRDRVEASRVLRALGGAPRPNNAGRRRASVRCSSPIVCGARDNCAGFQHLARAPTRCA